MTDSLSPPPNNGSINYSAHLRQADIIQGELLISSRQDGHVIQDNGRRVVWKKGGTAGKLDWDILWNEFF